MQTIDQQELVRVIGGASSPMMQATPGGGYRETANPNPSPPPAMANGREYSLGGQIRSPGAFSAHYPGGGGSGRP